MELYCENSWDDLEFISPDKTLNYEGIMHCSADYDESCSISLNAWQCDDNTSACHVSATQISSTDIPSPIPTSSPSGSPTDIPSTDFPTFAPTVSPTKTPLSTVNPS